MRFKILLIVPLLIFAVTAYAKPVFDSVGVENLNGKKIILHKVEPKETYFGVGRRYNIKPSLIIQFNNNIVLQPGATIKVPTELPFATPVAPAQQQAANKPEEKRSVQQYKVSAGETLYAISRRFGTTVDAIKADNNLKSDVLAPGELLTIKTSAGAVAKPAETVTENKTFPTPVVVQQKPVVVQQPVVTPPVQTTPQPAQNAPVNTQNTQQYKVSNGETLYTIAKRFNTSVDDIIALNKLSGNSISPGQVLLVRSGMPPVPKPAPQEVIAKRDSTQPSITDSLDRHIPSNRYGLYLKDEKGPATWMDDPSFDPKKQLVLHRTAPIGTVMKITNPMTNRSVFAKVVGRFTDNETNKDVIVVVTKNVADMLGVMDKRFRVNLSYGVKENEQ